MTQKAILDVVQEISDDSEIIARLKRNTQLKEKYFTADRSEKIQVLTVLPGIDSPDLSLLSAVEYISLSIGQLSHYPLKLPSTPLL